MASRITLPEMGEGVIEGTLSRWLVKEGDRIEQFAPIAEVETDKVTTETTSESAGVILKLCVNEGQTVPVGTVLAYVGEPGETVSENGDSKPVPEDHPPAQPSAMVPAPPPVDTLTKYSGTYTGRISPVVGRIAAGKIAAGGAVVGHEEGVADKDHAFVAGSHQIAQAGRGVARRVHGPALDRADRKGLVGLGEVVELAAIAGERVARIEEFAENGLYLADVCADGDPTAQLPAQVGRGGEMVGVGVGLEYPRDRQALCPHPVDDPVGLGRGSAAGGMVVVEDAVDDGSHTAVGIADEIGNRAGVFVEECSDIDGGRHARLRSGGRSDG